MRMRVVLVSVVGLLAVLQAGQVRGEEKGVIRRAWDGGWEFVGDVTTPHPTRGLKEKMYDAMVGGGSENLQPVPRGMNHAVSKPGYRATVTKESLAFYRYCMEKQGRGEPLNWSESWTAQYMQATRQWPEKPITSDADRYAQKWGDNPKKWNDYPMARATLAAQSAGGKFEMDLPPPRNMDKFRKLYHRLQPEQRTTAMNVLMKLFKAQSYDMRSDKQRAEDAKWEAAQKEKEEAALEKERERQQAEAKEPTQYEKDQKILEDMRKQNDAVEALKRLKAIIKASKDDRFKPGMIAGEDGDDDEDESEAQDERDLRNAEASTNRDRDYDYGDSDDEDDENDWDWWGDDKDDDDVDDELRSASRDMQDAADAGRDGLSRAAEVTEEARGEAQDTWDEATRDAMDAQQEDSWGATGANIMEDIATEAVEGMGKGFGKRGADWTYDGRRSGDRDEDRDRDEDDDDQIFAGASKQQSDASDDDKDDDSGKKRSKKKSKKKKKSSGSCKTTKKKKSKCSGSCY